MKSANSQMKSLVVLSIIVLSMFLGYLINAKLQKTIRPRQSFSRLLLYFITVLVLVFTLSFLMVLLIGRLYPDELIK